MSPADLRSARKRLGLTQRGLAEALRMGTHGWQTISAWESDSNTRGVPGPAQVAIEALLAQNVAQSDAKALTANGENP